MTPVVWLAVTGSGPRTMIGGYVCMGGPVFLARPIHGSATPRPGHGQRPSGHDRGVYQNHARGATNDGRSPMVDLLVNPPEPRLAVSYAANPCHTLKWRTLSPANGRTRVIRSGGEQYLRQTAEYVSYAHGASLRPLFGRLEPLGPADPPSGDDPGGGTGRVDGVTHVLCVCPGRICPNPGRLRPSRLLLAPAELSGHQPAMPGGPRQQR
jgi:hypothetical protein